MTPEYNHFIKPYEYQVFKYFFPTWMEQHANFVFRFFKLMNDDIPHQFKRRKGPNEYIESAVMILNRIDQMLLFDIPVVLGTKYLDFKHPWASCGSKKTGASFHFADFEDICKLYFPKIKSTNSFRAYYAYSRLCPTLPFELAKKHKITHHSVVSLAVIVTFDLIKYCGPDCDVLFDLFSNDLREEKPNFKKWEDVRLKLLGPEGKILTKPKNYKIGQLSNPPIPLESHTFLQEIPCQDITEGESTKPFYTNDFMIDADDYGWSM